MGLEGAALAAAIVGTTAAVGGTVAVMHSANQESKAAAEAQKSASLAKIAFQEKQEMLASETARSEAKRAAAKRSRTILTNPSEIEEISTNKQSAIGVG